MVTVCDEVIGANETTIAKLVAVVFPEPLVASNPAKSNIF